MTNVSVCSFLSLMTVSMARWMPNEMRIVISRMNPAKARPLLPILMSARLNAPPTRYPRIG